MDVLRFAFVVFFIVRASCEETQLENGDGNEKPRALGDDYKQSQWRAVENVNVDTGGWIPDDSPSLLDELGTEPPPPPKRRRLRKRKRRPPTFSLTDGASESVGGRLPQRRIRRPQVLNENKEPWKEMEEEGRYKPNKRRRIVPVYRGDLPAAVHTGSLSATLRFGEKEQVEVFQADEAATNGKNSTSPVLDLKALLKQAGGLSLSEILQQKNLSLTDLLNGERQAIQALAEKPPDGDAITEYKNPVEEDLPQKSKYSSSYRRTRPVTQNKPNEGDSRNEQSFTDKQEGKENTVYDDSIKYEEATERIFVPSHPKYYTSLDYKPDKIAIDLHTTEKPSSVTPKLDEEAAQPTSTTKPTVSDEQVGLESFTTENAPNPSTKVQAKHELPITNAKLNKKATKTNTNTTTIPPNAYAINISDLFALSDIARENDTIEDDEGPIRMSFDLDGLMEKTTPKLRPATSDGTTEKYASRVTANHIPATVKTTSTTTIRAVPAKLKAITAKDEIMEMLRDETAKDNLSKILASRNMTIEELVEQRERGSSQRHLADIFHNKTKEPEPKDEPHVGRIRNEIPFRPFTYFERKPKSRPMPLELKDSNGGGYVTSVNVEPTDESNESKSVEENKDKDKYTVTSFPTYKIEMDKKFKNDHQPFQVPAWKTAYPSIYSEVYESNNKQEGVGLTNGFDDDELHRLDVIENTISEAVNDKLNVDVSNGNVYNDDYDDPFIKLPYGVKSAIFASLLIIGISLLVFLTILVVFKWSQRHKQKLCYNNSLSCSKINSPILEGQPKRTLRAFMTETLGRKKHFYKQHLQSMSDSIWDSDRKPFQ